MRNLIVTSVFATAFLIGGATVWQANAAAIVKGPAPATVSQAEPVRCFWNAPVDGCGWGWWRDRRGRCRPC